MEAKDIATMSDEDFQKMNPPDEEEQQATEPEAQEPAEDTSVDEPEESVSPAKEAEEPAGESGEEEPKAAETPQIDYKQFYETMTAPIKANGKELRIRSPQEAIKLMQMGANYTHKMQGLAPYRKKIQMLQKAGLFEDEKLNYLIDLASGDTGAIQKLLKDQNIDPLDMNVSEESKYVPGNHSVSDEEVRFQSTLDDLMSTPEGKDSLSVINSLDQASLSEIWKDPSLMTTLHEQRQNGVYKLITDEIEHQKILGNIPEGTPFLTAYKATGDYLLKQRQQQAVAMQNLPKGTLNQVASNSNRQAKAVAPTGRSRKPNQTFVDPFSLSDEDFEKQFKDYIG